MYLMNNNNTIPLGNKFLPYILITAIWLILFVYTGNISSHIGVMDDHEILNISKQLENNSLIDVIHQWLISDSITRFRPLYFVHRVLMTYLFGTNFTLISLYICSLGIISSYLFILSLSKLEYNHWYALVFAFTLIIGPQIEGWYLFGAQENFGIFLLAIVFFTMANYLRNKKTTYLFYFLFSLVSLSLVKESFILIVPALLSIYVFLDHKLNSLSFIKIFKKNWFFIIMILLVIFLEIVFIKFIQKPSYSISQQGDPLNLTHIAVNLLYISFVGNLELIVPLVLISIFSEKRNELYFYVILFVLVVIPQCIAHKIFQNRYYLPGMLFFSFTLMDLLNSNLRTFPISIIKFKKIFFVILGSFIVLGLLELLLKCGSIIITKNKSINEFIPNSLELTTVSFILFSVLLLILSFIKKIKVRSVTIVIFLFLLIRGNWTTTINLLEKNANGRRISTESLKKIESTDSKKILIVQDITDGISFELSHLVTTYLDTRNSKNYEIAIYFPNLINEKWKGSLLGNRYAIGLIGYEDRVKYIQNIKQFSPDLIFINERKSGLIENQLFTKNKNNLDKAHFERNELPIGRIMYVRK